MDCFYDTDKQQPRFREFWDAGVPFPILAAIAQRFETKVAGKELTTLQNFLWPFSTGTR